MSLSRDELEYLSAYVDGQIDDEDAPEVDEVLAKSEDARRFIEDVSALGDWVRREADDKAAAAKADAIVIDVLAEAEKLGGAKIIQLERERARRALNRQRVKEFGALVACAACLALLWGWPREAAPPMAVATGPKPVVPAPPPSGAPSPAATSSDEEVLFAGKEPGVEVDSVESPHQVSVFYLPGVANANASSVVVWIGDDQEGH